MSYHSGVELCLKNMGNETLEASFIKAGAIRNCIIGRLQGVTNVLQGDTLNVNGTGMKGGWNDCWYWPDTLVHMDTYVRHVR